MPHRAPKQIAKEDPLFQSFAINVAGPQYPEVEEITQRPERVAWVEEAGKPNA